MATAGRPGTGTALAGRYVLETRLGTGGAGVVWRAHDDVLGRRVAVKLLHQELADDPAGAARFRTEATAAARLTHPNAVVVFDIGRDGEHDYLVMELVDGPDLSALLRGTPLPPTAVAHLGRSVSAALGVAHARGLVHRDVKPGNVLVTRDGVPKVADFGIARAMGETIVRLTRPGNVLGTARYVAPEQLRDESVDARADVYALGLVLHEALTGQSPWGEGTSTEVAMRRLTDDLPPASSVRIDVPPGLDAVVARATRLAPDDRYADGAQLAAALAPFGDPGAPSVLAALVRDVASDLPATSVPASPDPSTATSAAGSHSPPPSAPKPFDPPPSADSPPPATSPTSGRSPAPVESATRVIAPTRSDGAPPPSPSAPNAPDTLAPPPPRPRRRRRRLRAALVVLVVAVTGTVGILGMQDGSLPLTGAPVDDLSIVDVADHDPLGDDGEERPELLDDAIDGDDGTWWQTDGYFQADLIPPGKDGVGLWFDLGDDHEVTRLELDLVREGTSFEVYVGDAPPDGSERPEEWGRRVAEVVDAGDDADVRLDDAQGRVVLVWFTQLAPDDDRFRAHVADVRIRGR